MTQSCKLLTGTAKTTCKSHLQLQQTELDTATGAWHAPHDVLKSGSAIPAWIGPGRGLWAPDMFLAQNGDYVVYFTAGLKLASAANTADPADDGDDGTAEDSRDADSAAVAGSDASPANNTRCIGTARSRSPNADFIIDARPLVCLPGYGASDDMTAFPGDRMRGQGVIDASPRQATVNGQKQLLLVYKTQGFAPSTIRMVQLSLDDGSTVIGSSRQLVKSIISAHDQADTVEAPSLVQNGDWFTLFVAHGNFDTCGYSTQWYKTKTPWSWSNTPTALLTSAGTGTCGPGSADVAASLTAGQSRIFFHGWVKTGTTTKSSGSAGSTRVMYSAALTFSDGTPKLGKFLDP